jgi:hypothetical protein
MVLDSLLLILCSGPTLLPFSKGKGTNDDWPKDSNADPEEVLSSSLPRYRDSPHTATLLRP